MEPETPQDRVVDENSLQSLLEVPSDIDRVKDLFWRLEDLSSFRPTPQQWHNQYLPLLNVYTERMKHPANKQGISRFYYACCRAPKRAHRTKVPDAERQRNRQQADKDACGQHFVALQHGNSFMEFQISEEVKNSTHTHDIDICNQKRPPKKIKKILGQQVAQGQKPGEVYRQVRAEDDRIKRELLERLGAQYIKYKNVHNWGKKYRGNYKDFRRIDHSVTWEEQQLKAQEYLESEGWKTRRITAVFTSYDKKNKKSEQVQSSGLVFSESSRLETLCRRGFLTLMDATHKTNSLGWQLYTLMVRDECGQWIPCGHFLTAHHDGSIIAEGLKVFREWTGGEKGWQLAYMLTDDSAAEQMAVRRAFPAKEDGTQPVQHLLCTTHSERTLNRRFCGEGKVKVRRCMFNALRTRRTMAGCRESVNHAIEACTSQKDKEYLRKEWLSNPEQWAMAARQHSCILLQVRLPSYISLPLFITIVGLGVSQTLILAISSLTYFDI
jgi:hypothetical protein